MKIILFWFCPFSTHEIKCNQILQDANCPLQQGTYIIKQQPDNLPFSGLLSLATNVSYVIKMDLHLCTGNIYVHLCTGNKKKANTDYY